MKLNAADASAKILPYLKAHSEAFDSLILSHLKARFDPEYAINLDDPLIAEALDVRDMGVILRNAGKHEQAAPFLSLLKNKGLLLSKYKAPVATFSLTNINPHAPDHRNYSLNTNVALIFGK